MVEKRLGLDPGPSTRRRKPISICKCLCWTIGFPLFCVSAWAIISYGHSVLQETRFPHKALYYTESSYTTGDVVRPLISDEQTFDVAVSVWVRAPEDEEMEYQRLKGLVATEEPASTSSAQFDMGGNLGKLWVTTSLDKENKLYRDEDILEKPLFSDIVFRGLRLSDRYVSAKVNFRLPTTRFLAAELTESDLRATFLLVPSSPSLLDHIKNFTSWMPDSVYAKRRPIRAWPFPLGSDERGEKTMSDLALESFSISVPLLELHDAASQCIDPTADATVNISAGDAGAEGPVVKGHPYVVTRTQLRIVRETSLLNATAYNAVLDEIKVHSCGQGIPGIRPNPRMCRRTYKSNGIFETKMELEVPTENGFETQWAYAPYLDTKAHAAGPLDIIPVPVNRENCSSTLHEDIEYVDVNWRIAFSGRTPAKQFLGDQFVSPQPVDHRASDMMAVSQQDQAELWNGALGHRFHDDAHPRRRIALDFVSTICLMFSQILLIHYWWTRTSTVGISTSSVVFLVASHVLRSVLDIIQAEDEDYATWLISLFSLIVPYLMCKAITRAEFGWRRWYPTLTRVPVNHRERASQRVDNRTFWQTRLGVFVAWLAMHYLVNPDKIILIPTTGPALQPAELGPFADSKLFAFGQSVLNSLDFMGISSQVVLNHRSSAYGGAYRAQSVLLCLGSILGLYHFVPAVAGRLEWRMGLTLTSLDIVMYLPLAWQALTLRPVEIGDDDED